VSALVALARDWSAVVISGPDADRYGTPPAAARRGASAAEPVRVNYHRPGPEQIALDVEAGSAPAMIFVSEGYHPWWHAAVHAASAPLLRADVSMMAVPVGPGAHRIDLRFSPPGLLRGADLATALVWIALVSGIPIAWIRSRHGRR
jgi:hypothetical protein